MIYFCAMFHMSSPSGWLVITIKPIAKENICMATNLLFDILTKLLFFIGMRSLQFNQCLLQNDRPCRFVLYFLPPSLDTHPFQFILQNYCSKKSSFLFQELLPYILLRHEGGINVTPALKLCMSISSYYCL
jgi:hypothetical protein